MNRMIQKILLSMAALFLIWQSFGLLRNIGGIATDSWLLIIFIAWVVNLFITGIFAFSGFAFPTQKLLPSAYYEIRDPLQLKKVYKVLKVDSFRYMLLATLWKSQAQRQKYFNGKKTGISNLAEQSKKSEFGHLIPFVIISIVSFYLLAIGLVKLALFTFLINVIGNLYPIILQRHHRMRIQLIEQRQRLYTPRAQ